MDFTLFHGTSENNLENILENKTLNNINYLNDATEEINDILEKYLGENLRDGCIFLTDDYSYADNYENVISININDLNTNYLYVGDINSINSIYDEYCNNCNEQLIKKNSKRYYKSFIPFNEYILKIEEYNKSYKPEFLYFESISLNKIIVNS